MKMKGRLVAALLMIACLTAPALAADWFHIRITDRGDEITEINLPLSLIDAIVPMIEDHAYRRTRDRTIIRYGRGDNGWDIHDLRQIWSAYRNRGNLDFITVRGRGGQLRVAVDSGDLLIQATDRDVDEAEIRIPGTVLDALLSGPGDDLDIAGALRALSRSGRQLSVTARDGSTLIRIWVDGNRGQ